MTREEKQQLVKKLRVYGIHVSLSDEAEAMDDGVVYAMGTLASWQELLEQVEEPTHPWPEQMRMNFDESVQRQLEWALAQGSSES